MMIYILAFVVIALVIAGMALGAMVQNKPLKGSCGGLNNLGLKENCSICGGNDDACEKQQRAAGNAALREDLAVNVGKR